MDNGHSLFPTATLASTCRDPRTIPKAIPASQKCLPRVHMNISEYSVCKTKIYYFFLCEAPFILTLLASSALLLLPSDFQRPIPCSKLRTLYPDLSGISFRIHNTSSGNELCVWDGPEQDCSFNALIDFDDLTGMRGISLESQVCFIKPQIEDVATSQALRS